MKKVLLSALVAVMLVSPALARPSDKIDPADKPVCFTAEQILEAAPPGAKFVRRLTADEVKNFVRHLKITDNIDGVNLYSSVSGEALGASVFFTFKGVCTVGTGAFRTDLLKGLISSDDDDGSL